MRDDDYMKPSERPGEGSMLHQLFETEKSHAVADDIAHTDLFLPITHNYHYPHHDHDDHHHFPGLPGRSGTGAGRP